MTAPNLGQLITSTLFHQKKEIADSMGDNNALHYVLDKKNKIRKVSGGYELRSAVAYQDISAGLWHTASQELPTTWNDVLDAYVYDWKQLVVPVGFTGKELLMNSGSNEQLIDLAVQKVDIAKRTLKNILNAAYFSDGTGSSGLEIGGLQYLLSDANTTGIVGDINRATQTWAQHKLYDFSAAGVVSSASTIQDAMLDLYTQSYRADTGACDLWMLGSTYFKYYHQSLQGMQIVRKDSDLAKAGFTTLEFMGGDVVLGGGQGGAQAATRGYAINTEFFELIVHRDRYMVPLKPDPRVPVNQDSEISYLGFMGNLAINAGFVHGTIIE